MTTRLDLDSGYYLSSIGSGDEDALVSHFADGTISEMIPALPFPYNRKQAESWVSHRLAFTRRSPAECTFAIRRRDGFLVGSVGVDDFPVGERDAAEFGYWLAPDERGKGLATAAALVFVQYGFSSLGLKRITARTLSCNPASRRVLEKIGFQLIEIKPKFTVTRIGRFDTLFFELLRP